jgi:hypothetical protein
MRWDRPVVNCVASLPRKSAEARDTLGGSRHCGVVGYCLAVWQKSVLWVCGDFDLDRVLVPDPVSQRKATRTSETISILARVALPILSLILAVVSIRVGDEQFRRIAARGLEEPLPQSLARARYVDYALNAPAWASIDAWPWLLPLIKGDVSGEQSKPDSIGGTCCW